MPGTVRGTTDSTSDVAGVPGPSPTPGRAGRGAETPPLPYAHRMAEPRADPADHGGPDPDERVANLKERVYITFTALAVVLALRSSDVPAGEAAATLLIVVAGTVPASFVADVVAHIAVPAALPVRSELGTMVRATFGALGALALPFVFVCISAAGAWRSDRAL